MNNNVNSSSKQSTINQRSKFTISYYYSTFFKNAIVLMFVSTFLFSGCKKTEPDKMEWWHEAKFGMFIHWGLYSVPAGLYKGNAVDGYGEWIMSNGKIPVAEYAKYAGQFNPVDFNAEEWVKLAKEAGMKYIVITSKHHDGFALFDTKVSDFDVMDATPFKRDIIREIAAACKKYDMPLGLYYSQAQDWHHAGGSAMNSHWDPAQEGSMDKYISEIAVPQVEEILNNYGDIKILWWDTPTDMNQERASLFKPVLAKSPNLITNDRLGGGIEGDLQTPEQYIPATGIPGKNWEACMTMNDTWGFKTNDYNWKSTDMLVRNLIDIASKGGNYLLNVGPTALGMIPGESVERLKEIGDWMKVNGEAIYGTTASPFSSLSWGRCTVKKKGGKHLLYLHVFDFPADGKLIADGLASKVAKVYALNNPGDKLEFTQTDNSLEIEVKDINQDRFATLVVVETKDEVVVYNAPVVSTESSVFLDEVLLSITTEIPNAEIRYTTDGSIPTKDSPVAVGNVSLQSESSFTLKAMCFLNGKPVSGTTEHYFEKAVPNEPVLVKKAQKGLKYSYFEGSWKSLPDFSSLVPKESGIAPALNLSMQKSDSNFGVTFSGYIEVPETAVYHFILASDDGSKLTIAGKTLEHDGLHGMTEKTLDIALQKGVHPFSLDFFQGGGGSGLNLKWKTQGRNADDVPANWYLTEK
jgi:alpha-L-fucosidase